MEEVLVVGGEKGERWFNGFSHQLTFILWVSLFRYESKFLYLEGKNNASFLF